MSNHNPRATFENYLEAFTEPVVDARERLMRSSVAEDVAFSNPGMDGHGLDSLLAHIALFQERFPNSCFRINWLRQQHGQVLAEWTQFNQDGSEFLTAHSYARLNDEGRIAHFAGFWQQPGSDSSS